MVRNGLWLGEWKKKRFEPSQPLALSLKAGSYAREWHLPAGDTGLEAYLHGETISAPAEMFEDAAPDGWTLVCADRWPVGWGKAVRDILKNHYPSGWRR